MADAFAISARTHFPLTDPLCDFFPTHSHLAPKFASSSSRLHSSTLIKEGVKLDLETDEVIRREHNTLIYNAYTASGHKFGFGSGPTCPQYLLYPLRHPEDGTLLNPAPVSPVERFFNIAGAPPIPPVQYHLERRHPETQQVLAGAVIKSSLEFLGMLFALPPKKDRECMLAAEVWTSPTMAPAKPLSEDIASADSKCWISAQEVKQFDGVKVYSIPGSDTYTFACEHKTWIIKREWFRWRQAADARQFAWNGTNTDTLEEVVGLRLVLKMGPHGTVGEIDYVVGQMWMVDGLSLEVRDVWMAVCGWVVGVEQAGKGRQVRKLVAREKVERRARRKEEAGERRMKRSEERQKKIETQLMRLMRDRSLKGKAMALGLAGLKAIV